MVVRRVLRTSSERDIMVSERQALSAWQDSLQEDIGVDEAAIVVDRLGDVVTRHDLAAQSTRFDDRLDQLSWNVDERFDRFATEFDGKLERLSAEFDGKLDRLSTEVDAKLDAQANRLMAAWRRDLLLIAVPQFMALVAILMGVGG